MIYVERCESLFERWLVNIELIWVDRPLDYGFAEPPGPRNKYHVRVAGLSIHCEHYTARCNIGSNHLLHSYRERDFKIIEVVIDSANSGKNTRFLFATVYHVHC